MKKTIQITITIDVEESNIGKYIIPRTNFLTGETNGAYVLGIPCMILSEPYMKNDRQVYDVKSMVTGIEYTIPTGWSDMYDTLEEANRYAVVEGIENPFQGNIIGMKYYPKDNSFNEDIFGQWHDMIGKECRVISTPFKAGTNDMFFDKMCGKKEFTFIRVKYAGKILRVLFGEWALRNE